MALTDSFKSGRIIVETRSDGTVGDTWIAAGGGTFTNYYPSGKGESSFTADYQSDFYTGYHVGNTVVTSSAGTTIRLGIKVDPQGNTGLARVCLYNSSDALLTGGNVTMDGSSGTPKWLETGDISYSLAAGTYKVLYSCANATVRDYVDTDANGLVFAVGYAAGTCESTPTISTDTGMCHGVRISVS